LAASFIYAHPYVASWHFSEVAALMPDVRCWAKTGRGQRRPNRHD